MSVTVLSKNMNTGATLPTSAKFRIGDLVLDTGTRQVSRAGKVIALPKLSYRLFIALATTAPDVLTHEMLTDSVWNGRAVSADTIMQRIKLLRRALGDDASNPNYIGLVRGQGYRMLRSIEAGGAEDVDKTSGANKQPEKTAFGVWASRAAQPTRLATVATVVAALLVFVGGGIDHTTNRSPTSIGKTETDSIAQSIQDAIFIEGQPRPLTTPTNGQDARDAYMQGSQLLRRRTGATIEAAIGQFKEAIRRDNEFAPAYVGLADSYQLLPNYAGHSPAELLPLALSAVKTAIDIDSESGEAYASLAMIYFEASKIPDDVIDVEDPEPFFVRALHLSPDYATGNQWYGEYLSRAGRQEDAIKYFKRAAEIDPLSPIINHMLAHALWNLGHSDEAESRFRNAVSIDPGFARGYQGLAALYFVDLGRVADAALSAKQAVLLNGAGPTNFALLGNIYIHLGDVAQAERWVDEASRLEPDHLFALNVKTMLHLYKKDSAAAADEARRGLAIAPRHRMFLNVVKNQFLAEGNVESAIKLYETAYPELIETGAPISGESSNRTAVDLARVLQENNRHADASTLLNSAHAFVEGQPANLLHRTHVLHAAIHSLKGETQLALLSLRRAVDLGWRRNSFYHFDQDPNFDNIRGESEFQSMASEVRADLAAQLQELRAATESDVMLGAHSGRP